MNQKIAQFEKVSKEQFLKDLYESIKSVELSSLDPNFVEAVDNTYLSIHTPERSTACSAGYDFFLPYNVILSPGESTIVQTGIRCKMSSDYVLMIFPRSSLGFKYKLGLCNTVGIIDADYYNADNEGHVLIKLVNNGNKEITLYHDDKFAQGIFLPFGITIDDAAAGKRTGGFGSTD